MSAPVDRWKLGLFVVAGAGVLLAGLTFAGMRQLQRPCHQAYAFFDEPLVGLEPGSSVRFRGVPIGVVDDITLAPDKKHLQVLASLYDDKLVKLGLDPNELGPDRAFPEDLRAQLVTQYLTQTSFVLVDFYDGDVVGDKALPFEPPPNTIQTVRSTFRNVEDGLRDMLRELPEVAAAARRLLDGIHGDLQSANLPELSKRAEATLRVAEEKLAGLDRMPVVQSATGAFTELETLLKDWRSDAGPVNAALGELRTLSRDLRRAVDEAEVAATAASLRNAGDQAAAASASVGQLAASLQAELQQVRTTLAGIERLVTLLERDPGALLHGRSPQDAPLRKER